MAHIGSYLPSPGSAVWRRDVASPPSSSGPSPLGGGALPDTSRVRHVVVRDAEIWEEPAPYVVSSHIVPFHLPFPTPPPPNFTGFPPLPPLGLTFPPLTPPNLPFNPRPYHHCIIHLPSLLSSPFHPPPLTSPLLNPIPTSPSQAPPFPSHTPRAVKYRGGGRNWCMEKRGAEGPLSIT